MAARRRRRRDTGGGVVAAAGTAAGRRTCGAATVAAMVGESTDRAAPQCYDRVRHCRIRHRRRRHTRPRYNAARRVEPAAYHIFRCAAAPVGRVDRIPLHPPVPHTART